jgi:NADP-dependent 3-hydroxy acid dehydrogenase YdfG
VNVERSVVVVTGGARGIGAAVAEAAKNRGARVAIGDTDVALARQTAERVGALALALDVTSRESWDAFVVAAEGRLGGIDVLVNNAGIMPIGRLLDESDASTRRQLDVNVMGVLLGCKAVLPGMLARQRGHIVNIASMAGKLGVAGVATYSATKFAVVGLCQALDDELRETPVAVSCVLPGIVNTELSKGLPHNVLTPEVEPADVADAVLRTVERPRGEVWVPRSGRWSFTLGGAIPTRARNRVMRVLGLGDPMLGADRAQRAAYEQRLVRERKS